MKGKASMCPAQVFAKKGSGKSGGVWTALGNRERNVPGERQIKQPAKHLEYLPALPRDFLDTKPQADPKPTPNRRQTNPKTTPLERFRIF